MSPTDPVVTDPRFLERLSESLAVLADPETLRVLGAIAARRSGAPPSPIPPEDRRRVDALVEAGFLTLEGYVVAERMFNLQEMLWRVVSPEPAVDPLVGRTALLPKPPTDVAPVGVSPRLIVVHGPHIGQEARLENQERVRIGRDRACDLSLEFDTYTSGEHAEVTRVRGEIGVVDLFSRNGTYVNWRRLPPGGFRALLPGDVVGVGRNLLVFQSVIPPPSG
ncbi:MAG TPA: FHA domain-containing protein [Candidatus Thermoplasmatota archaeon]|nr:FHA domain-containing protein [Candidatus Thermoplasmatota archaeon]